MEEGGEVPCHGRNQSPANELISNKLKFSKTRIVNCVWWSHSTEKRLGMRATRLDSLWFD